MLHHAEYPEAFRSPGGLATSGPLNRLGLTPPPGELLLTCGMHMLHGSVVVQ